MKNPAVKYGVYALAFTLIWTLIEHVLGYNTTNHATGQYARMLGAWVFYVLVIVAVFQARKQHGGALTFGEGFKTGAVVSLIYSLGVTVIYSLYGEVINKEFKPSLMAFERAKLVAQNASVDVIDAKMKMIDLSSGGSFLSYVFLFVFMFIGGIVFTLIGSLIFMRKRKATA